MKKWLQKNNLTDVLNVRIPVSVYDVSQAKKYRPQIPYK